VLGVGAYVIGHAARWHPEALGLAAIVAGLLLRAMSDLSITGTRGVRAPVDADCQYRTPPTSS
jgi:hypothetical protein